MEESFAQADPETANERALVMILADASGSMNTIVNPQEDTPITRADQMRKVLNTFVSDSPLGMHSVSDFDGTAELALGFFWGTGRTASLEWVNFPEARIASSPFHLAVDIKAIPQGQRFVNENATTPLGETLTKALDTLEARRVFVRDKLDFEVKRPILIVITDGRPTDLGNYAQAAVAARAAEEAKRVLIFVVGVYGADEELLSKVAPYSYHNVDQVSVNDLVKFMSTTLGEANAVDDASPEVIHEIVRRRIFVAYNGHSASRIARAIIPEDGLPN
ncbi:VWA domain-containing protein [Gordonia sputi]